jgi:phosphatidylinositol glycan class A protein
LLTRPLALVHVDSLVHSLISTPLTHTHTHTTSHAQVFYLPLIAVYNQSTLPTAIGSFFLLRSVFLRERVQIVHGHSAFSSLANEAMGVAATLGIHSVFTDHSLFGFSDASAALTNKLLRYNLLFASRVICVSHTGRENTVLRSGLPPEKVFVIPNAIDPCSFRPDPAVDAPGASSPGDRITVVVMSRLVYRKGVDLLVRVIPAVCAMHPHVDFVVGGDGPKRVEIEEVRDRHALQGRVRMLGAVQHEGVRDVMCAGHVRRSL